MQTKRQGDEAKSGARSRTKPQSGAGFGLLPPPPGSKLPAAPAQASHSRVAAPPTDSFPSQQFSVTPQPPQQPQQQSSNVDLLCDFGSSAPSQPPVAPAPAPAAADPWGDFVGSVEFNEQFIQTEVDDVLIFFFALQTVLSRSSRAPTVRPTG